MGVMILTVLHYVLCFVLIVLVLLQAGKGGGLAAAFGGGSSETIFGARRGNIMTKITAVGVSLFMVTSLLLVIILPKQTSMVQKKGLITEDKMRDVKTPQIPGLPVGGPPPVQTPPGAPPATPPSPETPAPTPQPPSN
ncbi:MAG: preprotein translocase subunit SecG [bacterium]|nr:preprotein translocase subunit SecG [bacterium]